MTQLTIQLTAGLTTPTQRCMLGRGSTAIGADGKIQSTADILCYNEFAYRFAPFVMWIRLKAYSTDEGVFIVFIYQYTVP